MLVAAAISPACSRHPQTVPTATYTHPTIGLTLTVPRALGNLAIVVGPYPAGFWVEVEHAVNLGQMTVELVPGVPSPPGHWPKTRTVGDAEVHYTILDTGSGFSDGKVYELTAWRPARDGHVLFKQIARSDMGEPDFEVAWSVIEGTKLSP